MVSSIWKKEERRRERKTVARWHLEEDLLEDFSPSQSVRRLGMWRAFIHSSSATKRERAPAFFIHGKS